MYSITSICILHLKFLENQVTILNLRYLFTDRNIKAAHSYIGQRRAKDRGRLEVLKKT